MGVFRLQRPRAFVQVDRLALRVVERMSLFGDCPVCAELREMNAYLKEQLSERDRQITALVSPAAHRVLYPLERPPSKGAAPLPPSSPGAIRMQGWEPAPGKSPADIEAMFLANEQVEAILKDAAALKGS